MNFTSGKCEDCQNIRGIHLDSSTQKCVDDCGDAKVMIRGINKCDDGNKIDGDGCNSKCEIESGF